MRAHLAPSGLQQDAAIPLATGRSYLPGFDGLRAIAIAVVFVAHLGWEQSVPGGLGVTLFFFLSGFLINRLLVAEMDERDGRIDLAGFWARRLARLAPPLVVFMAVSGIALWALGVPPEVGHVVAVQVSFALALASWHFVEKAFWRLRLRFGGRPVGMLEAVAAPVPMPARSAGSLRP